MAESSRVPLCSALLALVRCAVPSDLYTRAVQLEADGNQPAALALLWEAAGLAPRDADVQQRLGEALERIGALDAAIDAYRRAIAARPDFTRADNSLTLALTTAGRGPEAVERARARVAEAPGDPERHFTLGLAQSEQDVDEAIRTFSHVLTMRPDHALAHYNLALVLKRVDRTKDAIAELQRALAIQPRAEAHFALGTLYFHQGDFDRAAPPESGGCGRAAACRRAHRARVGLQGEAPVPRRHRRTAARDRAAARLVERARGAGDRAPAGRREGRGCPGGR